MEIKNHGLLPEPPRDERDHLLGEMGDLIPIITNDPLSFWLPFNPVNSYQQDKYGVDLMACVGFSVNDGYERFFNYLVSVDPASKDILDKLGCINENGQVEFSDRFTAIMSGTDPNNGNSVTAVCNAVHTYGLLGEKWLPWDNTTMTKAEFYDKSKITQELKDKAKELTKYFDLMHAWIGGDWADPNELKDALTKGVVRVSVDGNNYQTDKDGNIYICNQYTHSVLEMGGVEPKYNVIHDHYSNQYPRFAWGYRFGNAKLLYVKKKSMIETSTLIRTSTGKISLIGSSGSTYQGDYAHIVDMETWKFIKKHLPAYKPVLQDPDNIAIYSDNSEMCLTLLPKSCLYSANGVNVDAGKLTEYLTSLSSINDEQE